MAKGRFIRLSVHLHPAGASWGQRKAALPRPNGQAAEWAWAQWTGEPGSSAEGALAVALAGLGSVAFIAGLWWLAVVLLGWCGGP